MYKAEGICGPFANLAGDEAANIHFIVGLTFRPLNVAALLPEPQTSDSGADDQTYAAKLRYILFTLSQQARPQGRLQVTGPLTDA